MTNEFQLINSEAYLVQEEKRFGDDRAWLALYKIHIQDQSPVVDRWRVQIVEAIWWSRDRDTPGYKVGSVYHFEKSNIFSSYNEAKQVLAMRLKNQIQLCQQTLDYLNTKLEEFEAPKHYVSPFTGQIA